MKRLIEQRYLLRHNLLVIVGLCLCVYFSYHLMFGTRSYLGLIGVDAAIENVQQDYDALYAQRMGIESKVIKMRPGSVDKDLLEERVRLVLGYSYADEHIIIQ